jgi:hypothetical protein
MKNMNDAPDYKKIYTDILDRKYPDKISVCQVILNKKMLSTLDIITLNKIIFGEQDKEAVIFNQKLSSYCEQTVKEIIDYQKEYKLNNTQVAIKFKLSRNSIAKWKKKYQVL